MEQPGEVTPFLHQFGSQAAHAAALVRLHPELAQRMALAPRRALHVYGAVLQQHAADEVPLDRTADLLQGEHPRTLLCAVIPDPHERLYRVLDRSALPAWPLDAYRRLNAVLFSNVADLLFNGTYGLMPGDVEELEALLTADPIIQRARKLTQTSRHRNSLTCVVTVLRSYGALLDLEALPDRAGARAVARRTKADLARIRLPDASLPEPSGWTRLLTVGDLWQCAARLELCIAPSSYGAGEAVVSALMGQSVFMHSAEHGALVQVHAAPNGMWVIAEVAIAGNSRLPRGLVADLRSKLVAAGAAILPVPLDTAINRVLRLFRNGLEQSGDPEEITDGGVGSEDDDGEVGGAEMAWRTP